MVSFESYPRGTRSSAPICSDLCLLRHQHDERGLVLAAGEAMALPGFKLGEIGTRIHLQTPEGLEDHPRDSLQSHDRRCHVARVR